MLLQIPISEFSSVDVLTPPPLGLVCVVKPEGVPQLCQTDEIGELCVCSIATGTSYYGLTGMTKNTFEVSVCPRLLDTNRVEIELQGSSKKKKQMHRETKILIGCLLGRCTR